MDRACPRARAATACNAPRSSSQSTSKAISGTFFKPPHDELRELYGIDVQELNVWRPLIEHASEYLSKGKLISTEADAFWLPDTTGTDYRRQHTKSTIILADIDVENRRLGYFPQRGIFHVGGR